MEIGNGLELNRDENGLYLTDGELTVRGDFTKSLPRLKQGALRGEMLVKAAKIRNVERKLTLIDATAGLGEDSILLAAAGFRVTMYEKDTVIAALLRDALERAQHSDIPLLAETASRMNLIEGDSIEGMNGLAEAGTRMAEGRIANDDSEYCESVPDVILLDPMFPQRQKSGLIKKKFQLLQKLESPCPDEETLLEAAMNARPAKIVIKRPAKGPYLAGKKPDYSIDGKAIRYDCFVFPDRLNRE